MTEPSYDQMAFLPMEQVLRRLKERTASLFKQHDFPVTKDQWIVLKCIADSEVLSQKEISEQTFKDPAALTRILDLMEEKNLLRREASPMDRRSYDVKLSVDGSRLHRRILPLVQELREQALAGISKKEIQQMNVTLRKINQNLV